MGQPQLGTYLTKPCSLVLLVVPWKLHFFARHGVSTNTNKPEVTADRVLFLHERMSQSLRKKKKKSSIYCT